MIRTTRPEGGFGEGSGVSGSGERNSGETDGPVPTEKVVMALLDGPGEADRAAGLGTALPTARAGRTAEVERAAGGAVTVRLPLALKGLDSTALRQLTCTIAYSQDADGQVAVELTGQDGTSRSGTCGLALGDAGNTPAPTEPSAQPAPSGTSG
ncbi:hypothetical protein [Streptomyces sp. NPDC057623]|uniref:hypothetical protein n=1 Tax=Streptomyces sp. NPDC057623 TaxID=3346187 RepID=UPI00368C9BFA